MKRTSEFQKGFAAGQAYYMNKCKDILANDIAQLYAVAFVVLKRKGYEMDWETLASDIQTLWNDVANEGINILDVCEEETGYAIRQGCITEDAE